MNGPKLAQHLVALLVTAGGMFGWLTPVSNAGDLGAIKAFVSEYCIDCHGADAQEADRRFDTLASDAIDPNDAASWHEVLDRLNVGDMPPADYDPQPSRGERLASVEQLTEVLARYDESVRPSESTVLRRLNRHEYDAAIRQVLGLQSMLADPTADFSPDEAVDHFRNVGDRLIVSDFLLTRYLEASDAYLAAAERIAQPALPSRTWSFEAPFCRNMPNPDGLDRDGEYQHLRENSSDRHGFLWLKQFARGVPQDGRYRIRVRASGINREHPYLDDILKTHRGDPLQMSIVASDTRAGDLDTNNSTDRVLAVFEVADDEPQWYETTAWLDQAYQPKLGFPNGPAKIKYMRHRLMRHHRDSFPKFISEYINVFESMHPDYDRELAPKLAKAFLDQQDRWRAQGGDYHVHGISHRMHTDEAWRQFYREYQGPRIRVHQITIEGPLEPTDVDGVANRRWFPEGEPLDQDLDGRLARFASVAFRRPVDPAEVGPFSRLVTSQLEKSIPARDALRTGYQAILGAPDFLYHRVREGELDHHELASRLAFFLTGGPPDPELRKLADSGEIADPAVLSAQTDRLIDGERFGTSVDALAKAWLHLEKLGMALPARSEHPKFYNEGLEEAMRTETRLYLQHAFRSNASVQTLIDSNHSFVNAPLARLYGLPDVHGRAFRRVTLDNPYRGGLLGHASVLTASANGIDTSPVLRGMWVLECLLGTPPSPPPPDIEPIEPDTRGTTTIREQLEAHRHVATCAACHAKIDPPGFALESFDEIGKFRTHYEVVDGWKRSQGAAIDPSGSLAGGDDFGDVVALKRQLLERSDLVRRNVVEKLLVHATGRIDHPADRVDVLRIATSSADAGLRELIHRVVQSEAFGR